MTTDLTPANGASSKQRWDTALNIDSTWFVLAIVFFLALIG